MVRHDFRLNCWIKSTYYQYYPCTEIVYKSFSAAASDTPSGPSQPPPMLPGPWNRKAIVGPSSAARGQQGLFAARHLSMGTTVFTEGTIISGLHSTDENPV